MKSENKTDFQEDTVIPECRKIRKPLMEKKRRARINDSLETLKQILLDSKSNLKDNANEKKSSQRTAKLEKADILEMTILYIQNLRNKIKSKSEMIPSKPVNVNYQRSQNQYSDIKKDVERSISIRPADSTCNSDDQKDLKLGITLVPTKLMNGDIAFIIPNRRTPDISVQKEDAVWRPW